MNPFPGLSTLHGLRKAVATVVLNELTIIAAGNLMEEDVVITVVLNQKL